MTAWRVGVFFLIFAPLLNVGVGAFGDSLSLICTCIILYYFLFAVSVPVFLPEFRSLSLLLVLTILYGLITGLLHSSEPSHFQVALRPLRALLMLGGLYFYILAYAKEFKERFAEALLFDIFIAISVHALLMIAQFIFPELRNAIYVFTFADQMLEFNQQFRMAGLTNGGGAQLSLFQAMGLVVWPLVMQNHKSVSKKVVSALMAICIAVSLLLSGRSGIILALMTLPVIVYFSHRGSFVSRVVWVVKIAGAAATLGGALYALVLSGSIHSDNWAYAERAADRSLDFILGDQSLTEHGVILDLKGMLFIPDDVATFWFGDPYLFDTSYLMGERIVPSDIGYIIFLFGYGAIGSLIQYAFYGLIIWYSVRYWRYNKQLALISLVWAVSVLIFHAKEVLVFSRIGFSLTVMIMAALALEHTKAVRGLRMVE